MQVEEIVHPNVTEIVKTKTVPFLHKVPSRSFVGGVFSVVFKLTRDSGKDAGLKTQKCKALQPMQEQNASCVFRRLFHLE